jgi:hypothetical protein
MINDPAYEEEDLIWSLFFFFARCGGIWQKRTKRRNSADGSVELIKLLIYSLFNFQCSNASSCHVISHRPGAMSD